MGRVAGAFGVRGWIKVAPGGGASEPLERTKEWWIDERAYPLLEAKVHSGALVAKLAGVESREQAAALKGREVCVRRDALPEVGEGHYYLADLVGLEVVNEQGERLGTVREWTSNGAQDVMEVKGERTHRIPWVAAIVK